MPSGVGGTCQDGVALDGTLLDFTIFDKHCAAVLTTHVEEHVAGAIVLIIVAVDAMVVVVVVGAIVFVDRFHIKAFKVALIESHL